MTADFASIFRICLVMTVTMIVFADFLGNGGASARKEDKNKSDSNENLPTGPELKVDKGTYKNSTYINVQQICNYFVSMKFPQSTKFSLLIRNRTLKTLKIW